MKILDSIQPLALLVLRAALGIIFISHGYPKLTAAGHGMQGMFTQHGLPAYFVIVAGVLETFGGALLFLGIFTRYAALLLAIEMGVAIWKVHSGAGLMAVREYEFPLSLAAACFALATVGAGMISLDQVIGAGGKARTSRPSKKPRD